MNRIFRSLKVKNFNNNYRSLNTISDSDRIFKNLYGRNNWNLEGDISRGGWYKTKNIIHSCIPIFN